MQMTLSSMMQQRGAALSIRLMSVAPCRCIILMHVINLMLTLHAAVKQRHGSYTCLLLPDFFALTSKQKQGSALTTTLSSSGQIVL